ncbi:MAG: CPBP family intramembrane metalloprotease [Clostridia bacterium]|nr:CPBP family intramembrane metalloprotease [Clostridia bacterium]
MEKKSLNIKDSALAFISSFLLCQFGVVCASIITLFAIKLAGIKIESIESFSSSAVGYLVSAVSLYLVMLVIFIFFNKNKTNKITNSLKLTKLSGYILIAAASFFALYPIIVCFDSLLIKCGIKLSTLPYELTTKNYFISLVSLVIAPAVCEELLFRGIIFKGLNNHGKVFAISLSAIMFSIFHMSISQTIYPLLMGLLLGVIMSHEQNIYYCIAVHMTNNFLSLTLSYFKINLIFQHWSYWVLAIILAVAFVSTILYLILKNKKEETKNKLSAQDKIYLLSSLAIMLLIWIIINFI